MRIPGGCLTGTGPNGTVEHDTFTCGHCNRVTIVPHRAAAEDMGGMCKQCMHLICTACVDNGRCTPFEKKLEAMESRERLRQAMGG